MVRRRSDTGTAPGHGLVLRREVDRCRRVGSSAVGVKARGDEYGTAACTDSGRIRRREGHVVFWVQRARDIARQVRQRDVGRRNVEVCVARRAGDEGEDVRERPVVPWGQRLSLGDLGKRDVLVRVAAPERPETPVSLNGGERRVVRIVSRVHRAASAIRDSSSEKQSKDVVVDVIHFCFVKGEQDQSTVVIEVGVVEQWGEPEVDPIARKVNCGIVTVVDHVGRHEHPLREGRGIDIDGKVVEVANTRAA